MVSISRRERSGHRTERNDRMEWVDCGRGTGTEGSVRGFQGQRMERQEGLRHQRQHHPSPQTGMRHSLCAMSAMSYPAAPPSPHTTTLLCILHELGGLLCMSVGMCVRAWGEEITCHTRKSLSRVSPEVRTRRSRGANPAVYMCLSRTPSHTGDGLSCGRVDPTSEGGPSLLVLLTSHAKRAACSNSSLLVYAIHMFNTALHSPVPTPGVKRICENHTQTHTHTHTLSLSLSFIYTREGKRARSQTPRYAWWPLQRGEYCPAGPERAKTNSPALAHGFCGVQ